MISPRHSVIYFAVLPGLTLLSASGMYLSLLIATSTYNSLAPTLAQRSAATIAISWSAEYQVRLADLRRAAGLPFRPNLEAAVRSSPADSRLWTQLALAEEQDGDFKSAEASFLRAATFGRDYDTLWTLTNFYFRRADRNRAVLWACAVLSIPGVEAGLVFSLLSNFPAKPDCILSGRFQGPESARLGYLQWLISRGALDAASPVADLLIQRRDPESVSSLLDYCDRLLVAGKTQMAAGLWNLMSSQGLVSAPLRGNSVLDGAFGLADPSHGFAWRTPAVPGADFIPLHPGLQIGLSGSQPDRCELLSQWLLLGPGSAHALRARYVSSGIGVRRVLHWNVTTPIGTDWHDISLREPETDLHDLDNAESFVPFNGPPGGGLIRLALVYERGPGGAPAQGWIRLEKIWLTE
jgi:hypothetical protein